MNATANPPGEIPDKPVFHYTSQAGLLGILDRKAIWATDILYLNDAMEFRYTFDLIRTEIEDLRQLSPNEDIPLLQRLDDLLDSTLRSLVSPFWSIFVCSFSSESDQLSQWRGYCPGGNGFSIGFDLSKLISSITRQNFRIAKCIYGVDVQKQIIRRNIPRLLERFRRIENKHASNRIIELLPEVTAFREVFLPIASVLKHPKFSEENEWRLVSSPTEYQNNEKICYRQGKSMIIPYFEFKLTEDAEPLILSEIIVGPTPHGELSKSSVENFIRSKNLRCQVRVSDIPYRTI